MKKTTIAIVLTLCSLPALAASGGGFHADEAPPPPNKQESGFKGSEDAPQTPVAGAKKMREGAWVTLEGHIEKQLADQRYQFRDKTDLIELKISPKRWQGADISPADLVTVSGRIHKTKQGYRVDVEKLDKQ